MKKLYYLLLSFILISCSKDGNITESVDLYFKPRNCSNIFAVAGLKTETNLNGSLYYLYTDIPTGSQSITVNSFFLSVISSNYNISNLINKEWSSIFYPLNVENDVFNNHDLNIEEQIKADYSKYLKSISKNKREYSLALMPVEYRLTPIKDFKITANCSLFGKQAGENLNNYFSIEYFQPKLIISSKNNSLAFGFSDNELPTSIDEWLALSPMAQPAMYLELKSAPPELPQTVQFTLEMETDTGVKLSYTSFPVTLTK